MEIQDCLPAMSKTYLVRIMDSIVREGVPRGDEERLREQIRQNIGELADPERVAAALGDTSITMANRILIDAILWGLLTRIDQAADEESLFAEVHTFERQIIEQASDETSLALSDARAIDIYKSVLDVALEDDHISVDEHRLLKRLRQKLGISRLEHRLLVAQLGKFPKANNELHNLAEYREAAKLLQSWGILFYCNRATAGAALVLPEELVPAVKRFLGYEMRPDEQLLLHDCLSNKQLRAALEQLGLPLSGSKLERSERLLKAGCRPSEVLACLSNTELADLCRKLQGVKVSGTKAERTDRIVQHFASLVRREPEDSNDPRAVFYQYFEEFAARDNQNLYQKKLIKHDRDMERGFEDGTRYLFEQKLGHTLIEMPGSDHADGGVELPNGELLLWDNKGKESAYRFPKAHSDQFKRYIRESTRRVTVFVVVVPEVDPKARVGAMRLKHDNPTDTDVLVLRAADLKWVAEHWRDFSDQDSLNLEVFNTTGVLDRAMLEERLTVLA